MILKELMVDMIFEVEERVKPPSFIQKKINKYQEEVIAQFGSKEL